MAGVETMAQARAPWAGIGYPIDPGSSPDEMMRAAKVDWTVSKRRPLVSSTTAEAVSLDGCMSVEDFFFLVRDSDNRVLGPAGKEYVVTQNAQAFDFFKRFTEAGSMSMETAGSLQGGRQVWVLAKLLKVVVLPGGDEVRGYLLFSCPHVWGKALVVKFVTIRVVCQNTFVMAMSESTYGRGFRMPHIRAFDAEVEKEALATLGIANELLGSFEESAQKLASARVEADVVVRYVADVMQPELVLETFGKSFRQLPSSKQAQLMASPHSPRVDAAKFTRSAGEALSAVNRQPGAGLESASGTMWGAYNGISYYIDHLAGRDRANALESAWFGPRSVLKTQAMRRAVEVAEAVL